MTKRRSRPARRGPGPKPSRPGGQAGPEQRRLRLEERREQQRAARAREKGQRRSLEGLQREALRRQREHEQRERALRALEPPPPRPEREASRKAYYREFRKVVEAADVVLEVLDARDPQGCRCPQLEQAVLQAGGGGKKLVLVLNKIDLVPGELVRRWLAYLRRELPTVAFKACTQRQSRRLQRSRVPAPRAPARLLASGACLGADCLLGLLANYGRSRELRTAVRVGVVGLPNVGKSSLINSLKRARACGVGAAPGVTRRLQEVRLDRHVTLLDSPGLLLAPAGAAPLLPLPPRGAPPERLAEAIVRRCPRRRLCAHYGLPPAFRSPADFLALLARRLGRLRAGGTPDLARAARAVLADWSRGSIGYCAEPPAAHRLPAHLSAQIVAEMGSAFDLEALERGNLEAVAVAGAARAPEDDDDEEEEEEEGGMEEEEEEPEPEPELGALTLQLRGRKAKKAADAPHKPPRAPRLEDVRALDPLHQGQGLAAASKRRKKLQKRANKLATKLSDSLVAALDLNGPDA